MENLILIIASQSILLTAMSKVAIGTALIVGGGTAIGFAIKQANNGPDKNEEKD